MWFTFVCCVFTAILLLFIPGYLVAYGLGLRDGWTVAVAPILSLTLLACVGETFTAFGVFCDAKSVPITMLLLGTLVLLVPRTLASATKRQLRTIALPPLRILTVSLYALVGIAAGYYVFLRCIVSPDSICQRYDFIHHINLVQSFINSGKFSSIGANVYMSASDMAIAPVAHGGFYPATWHAVCALVVELSGSSVATAINAVNFLFSAIVYPIGMSCFTAALFPGNTRMVRLGSITAVASTIFPWGMLIFGPIFPNLAAFCVLPIQLALWVSAFRIECKDCQSMRRTLLVFALGMPALALLQPNSLFTLGLLLIPYCAWHIHSTGRFTCCRHDLPGALMSVLFCIACAFLWYWCYRLSFLHDTVSFYWEPFANAWQELVNIFTQAYVYQFFVGVKPYSTQLVFALLVLIGLLRALCTRGNRWIPASYLLAALICFCCATSDDATGLRQVLGGFWYTDPFRLAANATIVAIPLATMGIDSLLRTVAGWVLPTAERYKLSAGAINGSVIGILIILVFMPSFELPGHGEIATPFGSYRDNANYVYHYEAPTSEDERAFLAEAAEVVGPDALVINNPFDGSNIAYGLDDMRIYYRVFTGFGSDSETWQSQVIRGGLCNYSTDEKVQQAVQSIGAQYVIRLDSSDSDVLYPSAVYPLPQFSGITSIHNGTSGFTEILTSENGKYHLYKIG